VEKSAAPLLFDGSPPPCYLHPMLCIIVFAAVILGYIAFKNRVALLAYLKSLGKPKP
jgi:hypothetical protein